MTLVVDDAQLMRLSAERAHDAADVLQRPMAFRPVVLLCCVVPPLWFALWSTLDSETAPWALRALAVNQAQRLEEWLEPGLQWPECELRSAPPLVTWLTAVALPWFPAGTTGAAVAISAISLMAAGAMLWQWCRDAIGERAALIVILLFAFHPLYAPLSSSAAPTALTVCLIVITAWGFWGHLEQDRGTVSFRLLAGGLAWGLALLSGGGVAVAFFAVLLLASLASRTTVSDTTAPMGERSAVRGVLLLGITGAALALWWPVMMWQSQGNAFLQDWLGIAPGDDTSMDSDGVRSHWTVAPGLLLGWWCLGCWSAMKISIAKTPGPQQRWSRWLLIWSGIGIGGRILWKFLGGTEEALHTWEILAGLPTTILAAQGLDRALRRETSALGLAAAITVSLAAVGWEWTQSIGAALVIGGSILTVLLLSAPLAIGLRRARSIWTERELRVWVLLASAATFIGLAATSLVPLIKNETTHTQWERIRQQMAAVSEVSQTSIVTNDERDLAPWIYLVRSLWPDAKFSSASGWDMSINATLQAEANKPESRIVLVDWSRSGLRFRADVGTGWQVDPVVEPMAFRGRRLAIYLFHPAAKTL